MKIFEATAHESSSLETFKGEVWPTADAEHYGDQQPNFFREEFTLIAKEDEDIVGYITVIVDSGVAQVEPLMVKTNLKGKGIGTELLKAAEKKAKALGAHKLWLETGADWKAKQFYEKHGYAVRTVLPHHTGGRDFLLMDKIL